MKALFYIASLIFVALLFLVAPLVGAADEVAPAPPPVELVKAWKLDPFYQKCILVEGLPVVGSAKVSDHALKEAAYLIRKMMTHRPDIFATLVKNQTRFAVMACSEMTTDIPEHRTLVPKDYWDARARGLGATPDRPVVTCGEENLLCLRGDPFWKGNILVHEFAHAVHERAVMELDPTFDVRLRAAFEHAKAAGLWKGTYSMQHDREYWAVAVQAWFDCVATNDLEHGPIGTREQLKEYDPAIAKLVSEIFGDGEWRYSKPATRLGEAHLKGFDPKRAGHFSWPAGLKPVYELGPMLPWLEAYEVPGVSTVALDAKDSTVNVVNRRGAAVAIHAVDATGKAVHLINVPANKIMETKVKVGQVLRVSSRGVLLGGTVASGVVGRVEIR